jgi:tetratricopeptide (TPR) repeat protein
MMHLDAALRLDPADKLARYHRARTLARLHRFDAAAHDFEELLRQSHAAVLLRVTRGDRDGARDAAGQALHRLDNNAHPAWEDDARALAQ